MNQAISGYIHLLWIIKLSPILFAHRIYKGGRAPKNQINKQVLNKMIFRNNRIKMNLAANLLKMMKLLTMYHWMRRLSSRNHLLQQRHQRWLRKVCTILDIVWIEVYIQIRAPKLIEQWELSYIALNSVNF